MSFMNSLVLKDAAISFVVGGVTAISLVALLNATGAASLIAPGYPTHFVVGGTCAVVAPLVALALTFTPGAPLG